MERECSCHGFEWMGAWTEEAVMIAGGRGGGDGEGGVGVDFAHFRSFERPVGAGILDYAEGIYPDVAEAEGVGEGYGVAECFGHGGGGEVY